MKLRFLLTFFALFLSLAISADRNRKSNDCSSCWSAPSAAAPVDEGLGVNIHFVDPQPGEMKMIADAGFRWVRMDFKWDLTERERGKYDFSPYDRLMHSLEPLQIRALFILDYGNPLYNNGGAPRTEAARQAFADWAVAAAKHFANHGVLWEIYNEPNIDLFWRSPNADEYAALAMAVGRAFRGAVPNEKLIGAATSTIDFPFLESCFKARLLDYWQGVSVHPYRQSAPETAATEYARLREMIARYKNQPQLAGNERAIPIISGEWGYSSVWQGMTEEKQAVMLARQFLTNVANGIPISIWYDWHDDGVDPTEAEHHFGLVRNNYQLKPAYLAAKTLISQLRGYRFQQRLPAGSDDDYVLIFVKGDERRIVAWTSSPKAHSLNIPVKGERFSVTRLTGETGGQVKANQHALSLEISDAPIYLAQVK